MKPYLCFVLILSFQIIVILAADDKHTKLKIRPVPQRLKNFKNLATELKTGLETTDWSSHPKFHLLPKLAECGFSANFLKNGSTSRNNSSSNSDTQNSTTTTTTEIPGINRQKRLVGGNYPTLGTFPWAARIDLVDGDSGNITLRCGASLLNSRYVLTSARCLTSIPSSQTLKHVALGTTDRRLTKQCVGANETICVNTTLVEIDQVTVHEDFVKTSAWNDIALIRLSEEVKFSEFVRPVCLPTSEKILDNWQNNKLTTYGWGRQESDDEVEPYYFSWNLQSLNMTLTPRDLCNRVYRRMTGKLDNSRFCAGGEAEKGTCKADTGGAVMKKLPVDGVTQDRYFQFGIISFGRCALEGIPSIYINVLYYMPWILNHIEP